MSAQAVRISQMVLTWGPGAILETSTGPRMILAPPHAFSGDVCVDELELSSPELSALIPAISGINPQAGQAIRIFQVPSNAYLGRPPTAAVWRTRPFPEWKLCTGHGYLYRRRCPRCGRGGQQTEAIRFVRACSRGHVDDVDWDAVVHGNPPIRHTDHYIWEGGGGALAEIRIRCPRCSRSASLGWAYGQPWRCSGRFPEREQPGAPPQFSECREAARIVQRQASNLRLPEVVTLFTVIPFYTRLHHLLRRITQALVAAIPALMDPDTPGTLQRPALEQMLERLTGTPGTGFGRPDMYEILSCSDQEIERAIRDVLNYQVVSCMEAQLASEFSTFREGARAGIPPIRSSPPASRIHLEIDPGRVRAFPGPGGLRFLVVPVLKLRAVTAQIGYRRMVGSPTSGVLPDLVDIAFRDAQGNLWYPGFESAGEGIFVMLDENEGWHPALSGEPAGRWNEVFRSASGYAAYLFRGPGRQELHPVFVWWHTLSHSLIRALAVDSGYSVPSIRERVYLELDDAGRARGGILLYTVARGGDGSLGGLVALVPVFDRILNRSIEGLQACSADPLCRDRKFQPGELMGAACHGCCLISETSCEHRNFWLDRHVVLDNLP